MKNLKLTICKKDERLKYLFFCTIFFPYVSFIPLGFDVQPYALLLSVFIVIKNKVQSMPTVIFLCFFALAVAFCLIPFSSGFYNEFVNLDKKK